MLHLSSPPLCFYCYCAADTPTTAPSSLCCPYWFMAHMPIPLILFLPPLLPGSQPLTTASSFHLLCILHFKPEECVLPSVLSSTSVLLSMPSTYASPARLPLQEPDRQQLELDGNVDVALLSIMDDWSESEWLLVTASLPTTITIKLHMNTYPIGALLYCEVSFRIGNSGYKISVWNIAKLAQVTSECLAVSLTTESKVIIESEGLWSLLHKKYDAPTHNTLKPPPPWWHTYGHAFYNNGCHTVISICWYPW